MAKRSVRSERPPAPGPDMIWVGGKVNGCWINDPSKPYVDPDMICARCHRRGAWIVPGGTSQGICLNGCPEPWHCPKCKGLNVPMHVKWCDGVARWCEPGACSICDETRPAP